MYACTRRNMHCIPHADNGGRPAQVAWCLNILPSCLVVRCYNNPHRKRYSEVSTTQDKDNRMALAHLLRTASACLNFTSFVKGNLSYYDLAIARAQYLARTAALPVQTETEVEIKVEDAQSWFVQASRFGARSVVS